MPGMVPFSKKSFIFTKQSKWQKSEFYQKYGNHVLNLPIEVEEIHRSDPDTYVDTNIQG
jgi:hypothetical protein